MVAHVRCFDEMPGGARTPALTLELDLEVVTARELIRRRVVHEVAARGLDDADRHVERAWSAFDRNGYFVIFGDRQLESLDEPVTLSGDDEVSFVRLVQLVGG